MDCNGCKAGWIMLLGNFNISTAVFPIFCLKKMLCLLSFMFHISHISVITFQFESCKCDSSSLYFTGSPRR